MAMHWARLRSHPSLSTVLSRHLYSSLATFRTSSSPQQLLPVNRQLSDLIQAGRLEDARQLFDKMTQRNTFTWNSMLTGYVRRREIAKARSLFEEIPDKDIVSWNLIISGYVSCRGRRYVEEGRYLFDRMPNRDFISWNTMVSGYAKNGRMDEAMRLFEAMPEKNVVSWNAMITGFLSNGDVKRATEFFKVMPTRDAASLSALVSGLIRNECLDEAEEVLREHAVMGGGKENMLHAYNTLIAGYGRKGRVEDARRLFDQIPLRSRNSGFGRNVISWNSMIMCYVKAGDMVSARDLFDKMIDRDVVSWNTMISGYVHASDLLEATNLFYEMSNPDALSWNSMISGYAREGKMEMALDFFGRMPEKTQVSWNTMIAGYAENAKFREAIELFIQMQTQGEKPDCHTFSSLLSVCAESADQHTGMQIHQLVTKLVIPDVPLNNSLITMYARCGMIHEAKTIFDEVKFQKNVISWNAMIGGYASHGHAKEALELFESMKGFEVTPTHRTFISVLSACVHGGLVEEGKSYFKSMTTDYSIDPQVEHYSLLVDIIGRFGHVNEAMDVITNMPMEPDTGVWGALLGACRLHNNVELARVAAESLMKLEPQSTGPYLLLHNMYIVAERWSDADRMRRMMEQNAVKKERGFSRVGSSCS